MSEYPVIKTPTPVDSILTFRSNGDVFKVVGCDPVCYGEKGYTLNLVQIGAVEERNHLIGREMTIDDRAFREYNGNKIKITKPKTTREGKSHD